MRIYRLFTLITLVGLMAAACSLSNNQKPGRNANLIFTAAAQTVEAQLTEDILSHSTIPQPESTPTINSQQTSTETPEGEIATITPQVAPSNSATFQAQECDAAEFVDDVTIPDKTKISAGESFTKTWRLKNIGSCTWNSSYSAVFDTGDQLGGPASIPVPGNIAPGQEVDISVNFQAPVEAGDYRSYWRLRNPSGLMLPVVKGYKNKSFYVDIQVKIDRNTKIAVTGVKLNVSHSGNCTSGTYTVTATVTTNGAVTVTYSWRRSDGISGPSSTGTLNFLAAGTQTINYDWSTGATGLSITLYIDTPNHQEFGTALLNCP